MLRITLTLLLLLAITAAPTAGASPLDLFNDAPRTVRVAFEVSPQDRPTQTDSAYGRWVPASLERGERDGELRVRIAGEVVERHLLPDEHPVAGSFSDFVWTFDVASGHVLSATLSGRVMRSLDWGFMRTSSAASIEVVMTTSQEAGHLAPTHLLGQLIFKHCTRAARSGCTLVSPTPYDAATGYVNAVGALRALSKGVEVASFSPLGEAMFSEIETSAFADTSDEGRILEPASTLGAADLARPADPGLPRIDDGLAPAFDVN